MAVTVYIREKGPKQRFVRATPDSSAAQRQESQAPQLLAESSAAIRI